MEHECPQSVRIHVVEDTALGSSKDNLSTEAMKALRNMGYYPENTAASNSNVYCISEKEKQIVEATLTTTITSKWFEV